MEKKDISVEKSKNHVPIALLLILIAVVMTIMLSKGNISISNYLENSPTKAAMKYYVEKYGNVSGTEGVRAVMVRLGCHEEIRIQKGEEVLMRAIYVNGQISETYKN